MPGNLQRQRAEPSLGRIDDIATSAPSRRALPAKRSSTGMWIGAAVAIVLIVGGVFAYMYQNRLRSMLPRTELNSLLTRADKALNEGRLHRHAERQRARTVYRRARDRSGQ